MAIVVSGYFLTPRGTKGEMFVEIYQKEKFLPRDGENVFIKEADTFSSLTVEKFFSYENGSVLKFLEISSREEASRLRGKEFFLEREEKTDFLGKELLGFEVFDIRRGKIGEVIDFAILSPYILLFCRNGKSNFEVPLVKGLGCKLLRMERQILFNLPDDYPGVDYEN